MIQHSLSSLMQVQPRFMLMHTRDTGIHHRHCVYMHWAYRLILFICYLCFSLNCSCHLIMHRPGDVIDNHLPPAHHFYTVFLISSLSMCTFFLLYCIPIPLFHYSFLCRAVLHQWLIIWFHSMFYCYGLSYAPLYLLKGIYILYILRHFVLYFGTILLTCICLAYNLTRYDAQNTNHVLFGLVMLLHLLSREFNQKSCFTSLYLFNITDFLMFFLLKGLINIVAFKRETFNKQHSLLSRKCVQTGLSISIKEYFSSLSKTKIKFALI